MPLNATISRLNVPGEVVVFKRTSSWPIVSQHRYGFGSNVAMSRILLEFNLRYADACSVT